MQPDGDGARPSAVDSVRGDYCVAAMVLIADGPKNCILHVNVYIQPLPFALICSFSPHLFGYFVVHNRTLQSAYF